MKKKYEYKVWYTDIHTVDKDALKCIESFTNKGWKLVAVTTLGLQNIAYYFRRRIYDN